MGEDTAELGTGVFEGEYLLFKEGELLLSCLIRLIEYIIEGKISYRLAIHLPVLQYPSSEFPTQPHKSNQPFALLSLVFE